MVATSSFPLQSRAPARIRTKDQTKGHSVRHFQQRPVPCQFLGEFRVNSIFAVHGQRCLRGKQRSRGWVGDESDVERFVRLPDRRATVRRGWRNTPLSRRSPIPLLCGRSPSVQKIHCRRDALQPSRGHKRFECGRGARPAIETAPATVPTRAAPVPASVRRVAQAAPPPRPARGASAGAFRRVFCSRFPCLHEVRCRRFQIEFHLSNRFAHPAAHGLLSAFVAQPYFRARFTGNETRNQHLAQVRR